MARRFVCEMNRVSALACDGLSGMRPFSCAMHASGGLDQSGEEAELEHKVEESVSVRGTGNRQELGNLIDYAA